MQKVSMSDSRLRFPAEWEPQSAILIAWPHAGTDWAERLAEVEETCIAMVAAITRFQRALVDRTRVVYGKSVYVHGDLGSRRIHRYKPTLILFYYYILFKF